MEKVSETEVKNASARLKTLWMRFLLAYHEEAVKVDAKANYAASMRAAKALYGTRDPTDPNKIIVKIPKDATDEQLHAIAHNALIA